MRAQAFMERGEWFEAVKEAEKVVGLLPEWSIGWQTLGRAQLGFGEPKLALASFEKASEIDGEFREVVDEDIPFAKSLVQKLEEEGLEHARLDLNGSEH